MKTVDSLSDDEFAHLVQDAIALPSAPADLVRAAIGLWPQRSAATVLRVIAAALSFDSWATSPLAAGMRSGNSATRHLLFAASGRDVDLRISPDAEAFAVMGQILGPDEACVISLETHSSEGDATNLRLVALDEFGEFRFDAVPSGTYLMTLRVGADEIELPQIVIGARA